LKCGAQLTYLEINMIQLIYMNIRFGPLHTGSWEYRVRSFLECPAQTSPASIVQLFREFPGAGEGSLQGGRVIGLGSRDLEPRSNKEYP